MDDADGPADETDGPGPVVCHRCGASWGDDRAFVPARGVTRDGRWSWTCVECAYGAAGAAATAEPR